MWSNVCDTTINVPEFGVWVLDGHAGAYCDFRDAVCVGVVEVFALSLLIMAACVASSMLRCHFFENDRWWAGSVSSTGRLYSFCAEDRPSLRDGVFLYCRRAQHRLSSSRHRPFHDVLRIFFIDFTVASIFPLL